jgi:hypothetical protein
MTSVNQIRKLTVECDEVIGCPGVAAEVRVTATITRRRGDPVCEIGEMIRFPKAIDAFGLTLPDVDFEVDSVSLGVIGNPVVSVQRLVAVALVKEK